jgi:hypothetical protein
MPEGSNGTAVRATLAQIDRSWQRLNAELDIIPRERMTEPGAIGVWSFKDLLGHIAFWDQEAVVVGPMLVAGETDPYEGTCNDIDTVNGREAAARVHFDLDQQWAEFRHAHAALLAYLDGQTANERDALSLFERLRGYTQDHYDEHTADLRAWRDRINI